MVKLKFSLIVCVLFFLVDMALIAQADSINKVKSFRFGGSLDNEGQYNITDNKANLVNVLKVNFEQRLWKGAGLQFEIASTNNLRLDNGLNWDVADNDDQVFSNLLYEKNYAFLIEQLDFEQKFSNSFRFDIGVYNMNVDFFNSSFTCLFTGSSHGMFPTIGDNFGMANFPASSLGVYTEWQIIPGLYWKNGIFNIIDSTSLNEVFRFRPNKDGFVYASEFAYKPEESMWGEYYFGYVEAKSYLNDGKSQYNYAVYGLIEQPVYNGYKHNLGILLQGSYSPKDKSNTYGYGGFGIVTDNLFIDKDRFGIIANRALYSNGEHETDIELTYNVGVTDYINIQPAFHFLRTTGVVTKLAIFRATLSF